LVENINYESQAFYYFGEMLNDLYKVRFNLLLSIRVMFPLLFTGKKSLKRKAWRDGIKFNDSGLSLPPVLAKHVFPNSQVFFFA